MAQRTGNPWRSMKEMFEFPTQYHVRGAITVPKIEQVPVRRSENHAAWMKKPVRPMQFVNDTQSSNEKANLSTVDKMSKEIAKQSVIIQLETEVS